MLATQVQYYNAVEQKRHNLETESQGRDSLKLGWSTLQETKRHNVETENISWGSLAETRRHNLVMEDIGGGQLANQRENTQIASRNSDINAYNAETTRTVGMRTSSAQLSQAGATWFNAETARYSAQQQAAIGWKQTDVAQQNADTASKNADIAQQNANTSWINAQNTAEANRIASDRLELDKEYREREVVAQETQAQNGFIRAIAPLAGQALKSPEMVTGR